MFILVHKINCFLVSSTCCYNNPKNLENKMINNSEYHPLYITINQREKWKIKKKLCLHFVSSNLWREVIKAWIPHYFISLPTFSSKPNMRNCPSFFIFSLPSFSLSYFSSTKHSIKELLIHTSYNNCCLIGS